MVIAKAERAGEFPTAQFVAADITRVFKGRMPERIEVVVKAATDSERACTIYARERYDVAYSYDVDIPLAFGNDFALSYTETVDGFHDDLSDLADKDIRVGDLSVVATIANSTPLDFAIDAQMLDAQGNPTVAQIVVDETDNTAFGSKDGTVRKSTISMRLALGEEGNLRTIADVDALRLTLTAKSPEGGIDGAALNKHQTLSASLVLNVKGGITADLDTLTK